MLAVRAETRIVGGDDHIAAFHHLGEADDGRHDRVEQQRRRAFARHAGGRMRPGDDLPAFGRRRLCRHHDHGRNRDRFSRKPGRAVEHARSLRTPRRAGQDFRADDAARRTGQHLRRYIIKCKGFRRCGRWISQGQARAATMPAKRAGQADDRRHDRQLSGRHPSAGRPSAQAKPPLALMLCQCGRHPKGTADGRLSRPAPPAPRRCGPSADRAHPAPDRRWRCAP